MLLREAPILVLIFDRGTESLRQTVSRFLMKKLRRRQNLCNILSSRQDFFDWILMCTRFFWLNPGPIASHWENGEIRCGLWGFTQRQGEIRCGLWGITQKKVWAAGSPLNEQWNKVRAFEEFSEEGVGCRQPTEPQWTVITFTVWAVVAKSLHIQKVAVTWSGKMDQKLAWVLVPEKMSGCQWATATRSIQQCKARHKKIRGSRVDIEPTAWGLDVQVWNLLWTGEEAMKKGLPILK